jgi:hypothetical protein
MTFAVMGVPELQILRSIVRFVAVDVMDGFVTCRPPPQHPRHNYTVFRLMRHFLMPRWAVFGQQINEYVSISVQEPRIPIPRSARLTR